MITEKIYSMVGISMAPTLVEPMILETEPTDFYNPGDVIVFIDRNRKTIVHRIVKRNRSGFTTRGDNNLTDDEPIVRQDILGKVVAAYRGEKRYQLHGGKYGYFLHRYLQIRKKISPFFVKMFGFWYHLISRSGFFIKLLPQKFKPTIIQYQNGQAHLYIGKIFAGRYEKRWKRWIVFRPWRIFVDEKSLPLPGEVFTDPEKEKLQNISRILDNENTLIPALSLEDWNELFVFAENQGIACYMYYALKQKKSEGVIPVDWQRKIRVQLMHFSVGNLKHLDELEELSLLCERNGINVIFLKGSHLAFQVYPSPSLRPMGDIDIIVKEDDIPKMIGVLLEAGYSSDYFTIENRTKYHWHFPPFFKEGKKSIELHWTLFMPMAHDDGTRKTMDWLIYETEAKRFGKGTALVFKPNAIIFQLMLHIGLNDNLRPSLKNLLDITVLIQKYQNVIDWDVISAKILDTSFVRRFALVGWLAKNTVGAKIPDHFFQTLNVEPSQEIIDITIKRISQFNEPFQVCNLPSILRANLFQKLWIMFKTVFVSPSKMKFKYKLKTNWEVFIHYPKRVLYLIRDYKKDVLKTLNPDDELLVKTKEELKWREWLNDEYFPR